MESFWIRIAQTAREKGFRNGEPSMRTRTASVLTSPTGAHGGAVAGDVKAGFDLT